jgi:hypothetical protein
VAQLLDNLYDFCFRKEKNSLVIAVLPAFIAVSARNLVYYRHLMRDIGRTNQISTDKNSAVRFFSVAINHIDIVITLLERIEEVCGNEGFSGSPLTAGYRDFYFVGLFHLVAAS